MPQKRFKEQTIQYNDRNDPGTTNESKTILTGKNERQTRARTRNKNDQNNHNSQKQTLVSSVKRLSLVSARVFPKSNAIRCSPSRTLYQINRSPTNNVSLNACHLIKFLLLFVVVVVCLDFI